jgi:hypothetical protein
MMATSVYTTNNITLIDGRVIEVSPLKIKYLRRFMERFENASEKGKTEDEVLDILMDCVRICMEQLYPELSHDINDIADCMDLLTIYDFLDFAAGIKINSEKEETVKEQASDSKPGETWKDLDLVKMEGEVFILGNWKNFDDLESSLCMAELIAILSSRRDLDYQEKKFLAAIQGVDLDEGKEDNAWEKMKQKILYKGKDKNDITNLSGKRAVEAGFGIGNGLDYEEIVI